MLVPDNHLVNMTTLPSGIAIAVSVVVVVPPAALGSRCRSRRIRSASSSAVCRAATTNAEGARRALAAILPLPMLAEESLRNNSSLSRRRHCRAVVSLVVKELSRAQVVARPGSLRTHYGASSDLANTERWAALCRS